MSNELSQRYFAEFEPNEKMSSDDYVSVQEYNNRARLLTLRTIKVRCRQLSCSAILRDHGGFKRGKVFADGSWLAN